MLQLFIKNMTDSDTYDVHFDSAPSIRIHPGCTIHLNGPSPTAPEYCVVDVDALSIQKVEAVESVTEPAQNPEPEVEPILDPDPV